MLLLLLEKYLSYISLFLKWGSRRKLGWPNKGNLVPEIQPCILRHYKISSPWNYFNCSKIKRNILKNLEFLCFGILIVQFCNKIHGLLRFKFPKLTYRKKDWQLPTSSMRPFSFVSHRASTPRGFCLIRYSILIGFYNIVLWISIW